MGAFNSRNVTEATTVTASLGTANFNAGTTTLLSNYVLPTAATGSGTITQRPLSTWTGKASGNWSDFANWDALPDDGRNVASVLIPAIDGLQVTYDLSALSLASLSNAARLSVDGARLTVGTLTNNGNLELNGKTLQVGTLTNSGTVLASGANTLASVVNSGAFNVASGSTQVTGTFTQTSGTTTLGIASAGSATLEAGEGFAFNAGRLAGTGTLAGNVNVNNAVLAPGFSPGAISVQGNLTLGPGSTLEIQLAGPTAHDQVSASGSLQLGGALQLSSLGGFRPAPTDRFNILSSKNSASGTFSTVSTTGANLETLQLANLQVTSTSGTATVQADKSTLANPAANSEIVTEIVKQTLPTTDTSATASPLASPSDVLAAVGGVGLVTAATRTLTPPAYVAPTPAPAPVPAPAPAASPAPAPTATAPTSAPSPAASQERASEEKKSDTAASPSPAPAPAASPSPSQQTPTSNSISRSTSTRTSTSTSTSPPHLHHSHYPHRCTHNLLHALK